MGLHLEGYIDLPEHRGPGGFDHAAVHRGLRQLYVAHTANDAIDVIDLDAGRYVESVDGLIGVAGALVDEGSGLVSSSNRGEDTVGIFDPRNPGSLVKVPSADARTGWPSTPGVKPSWPRTSVTRRTLHRTRSRSWTPSEGSSPRRS